MLTPLWALAKEEAEKASCICLNPSKLPTNDFLRLGLYTGKDAKAGEGVWWEPWFRCTVEGRAKGGSSWSPWNHAPQFHTSPATFLELEKEAFLCRSRSRPRAPDLGRQHCWPEVWKDPESFGWVLGWWVRVAALWKQSLFEDEVADGVRPVLGSTAGTALGWVGYLAELLWQFCFSISQNN